ncbi:MAG: hypothetical protein JJE25_14105 [Bacteroidia bacterium]|nr:hypothetical protein [Bacteroidia bacterium]
MRDTMTISKAEYRKLQRQAKAYQKLMSQMFESALSGSVDAVVEDFRNTDLYSEAFLKDLKEGLQKSSYA